MPPAKQFDLGNGSELLYFEKFLERKQASDYLESLNDKLPWIRPTLSVYGRKCEQVHLALPAVKFNSVLVNRYSAAALVIVTSGFLLSSMFNEIQTLKPRYTNGSDYAAWHADDEKVYGPTPTIASVTLGAEREFLIRRKGSRKQILCSMPVIHGLGSQSDFDVLRANSVHQLHKTKRKSTVLSTVEDDLLEMTSRELYTFDLKHGSLFVMQGYTQRDWEHSVPKRKRANGLRINLTFRYIISEQR
ncbi:hypothetical protein L7F22_049333 [Adiantum nelumboides]|nr:hypothetical protein [Adiantum nelumboides]